MLDKLVSSFKLMYKEEKLTFFIVFGRATLFIITFIILLMPFFGIEVYGVISYYTLKDTKFIGTVFWIFWLISIFLYLYLELSKNQKTKKLLKSQSIVLIIFYLFLLFAFFLNRNEAQDYSYIDFKTGIGFFLVPIMVVLVFLANLKPILLLDIIGRFIKIPKNKPIIINQDLDESLHQDAFVSSPIDKEETNKLPE